MIKKLYLSTNSLIKSLELTEYVQNYNLNAKEENISNKSINGQKPIEFIKNFL